MLLRKWNYLCLLKFSAFLPLSCCKNELPTQPLLSFIPLYTNNSLCSFVLTSQTIPLFILTCVYPLISHILISIPRIATWGLHLALLQLPQTMERKRGVCVRFPLETAYCTLVEIPVLCKNFWFEY